MTKELLFYWKRELYVANGKRLMYDLDCDHKDDAEMLLHTQHISQFTGDIYCRSYIRRRSFRY